MSIEKGLVVGVDLGTSGVRALAFDPRLRVVAQASRSYSVELGEGGVAEQPVTEVTQACEDCIREVGSHTDVEGRIQALTFCGTASSLAGFRANSTDAGKSNTFEPAGPAWIWADSRAAQEASLVAQQFGGDAYRRTGCPVHASYWPAKLLWWRRHELAPFRESVATPTTYMLAGQKDYTVYRLTGEWVTDRSTAAATGLYDSQRGRWDTELMDWLHVEQQWLPQVVSSDEQFSLLPEAADRLDLPVTTRIVTGSLDGVLVHLGMGCADEGLASCTIGTSGAARMSAGQRITDPKSRTWCYPVTDDLWLVGGAGNNGGNVLNWFRTLCSDMAHLGQDKGAGSRPGDDPEITPEQVIELAMQSAPGANGLMFMPYLFGERSPLWREDLTGAFVGLSPTHGAPHLARAVVEGISLGINGIYNALVEQIGAPREVRAGGGFVASHEWVQLQADIFGVPVAVTATGQETAAGAAMVGWHAIHNIPLQELRDAIEVTERFEPNQEIHHQYKALFSRLEALRQCFVDPAEDQA